jgi:hypothetical protein
MNMVESQNEPLLLGSTVKNKTKSSKAELNYEGPFKALQNRGQCASRRAATKNIGKHTPSTMNLK